MRKEAQAAPAEITVNRHATPASEDLAAVGVKRSDQPAGRPPHRVLLLALLAAWSCGGDSTVPTDFHPAVTDDGWPVSTAAEQGIAPGALEDVYREAEGVANIRSLIVVRNGHLIGEAYYAGASRTAAEPTASVTKSVTSALVGIALHEGLLSGLDQRMMDSFPEAAGPDLDPRKAGITLRQMLQMRSGYPWEERSGLIQALFARSNWIPLIREFPLTSDPGTQFGYSNLTAHLTGIVVARAAGASLLEYGQSRLFGPLGMHVTRWPTDGLGYCHGSGDLYLTPRDMARLGQLYLDEGRWQGVEVVPREWVAASWEAASHDVYGSEILNSMRGIGYGYLWWSASCGRHRVDYAWGHGGQLIVVVRDAGMVVVTTAEYLGLQFGDAAWRKESAVMELVGRFVSAL